MSEKLFTVKEAAEMLTVSESTLRTWIFNNEIEVIRLKGAVRFKKSVLEKILNEGV